MTRSEESQVFVADDPAVVATIEAWKRDVEAWRKKMDEAHARFHPRAIYTQQRSGGGPVPICVHGLEDLADVEPPPGWVKYVKYDYLRPARGKAGNEARALIEALAPPPDILDVLGREHGLPTLFFDNPPYWYSWGYRFLGGDETMYLTVAKSADTHKVPPAFRPVKLSEFYALVEADEEAERVAS